MSYGKFSNPKHAGSVQEQRQAMIAPKKVKHVKAFSRNKNGSRLLHRFALTFESVNSELFASRYKILQSADLCDLFREIYVEENAEIALMEYAFVVFMNRANNVIGYAKLSDGALNGTLIDIRLIAMMALECAAVNIALCHNHPSGNLTPSAADLNLTGKIAEGLKVLEMQLLDHIILTSESYYSFADEGLV